MGLVRAAPGIPVRFHRPRGLLAGGLRRRNCLVMYKRGPGAAGQRGAAAPMLFPTQPSGRGAGGRCQVGQLASPTVGHPPGGPGLGRRHSPAGPAACFR